LKALIELYLMVQACGYEAFTDLAVRCCRKPRIFGVISRQREVHCTTWHSDRFQPTTDDISRYFGRRTTTAEAGSIWIYGSHHQAYAFARLL